jgi:hypothetical protein
VAFALFSALLSKLDVTTALLILIILGWDSLLGNTLKLSTNSRLSNISTFPHSHHVSRINTISIRLRFGATFHGKRI